MGKVKNTSDKKAIALKVKPGKKTDPKQKNKVTGFKIAKKGKNDAETVELINQIKKSTSKKAEQKNEAKIVDATPKVPKVKKDKKEKQKKAAATEISADAEKSTLTIDNILPAGKTETLIQSLIDAAEKEAATKKDIFGSDYKFRIQIQSIKIPKCPERIARM